MPSAPQRALAVLLAIVACAGGCRHSTPPVGYAGPMPSQAALAEFYKYVGKPIPAGTTKLSPHPIRIGSSIVGPTGMLILIEELPPGMPPRSLRSIPVFDDGDLENLMFLAGAPGSKSPKPMSQAYLRAMLGN